MPAMSPTPTGTIQRPDLGMALAEFDLDMAVNGFIGQLVLPLQEVKTKMGNYGKFEATQLAKVVDTSRAPGAGYAKIDLKFTQANYLCEEHGVEVPLDDNFAAAYAYIVGGDREKWRMLATQIARMTIMRNHEKRIADAVFNATTWASYTSGVSVEWDTIATAVPITNVNAAIDSVRAVFGDSPDTLICSDKVYRNLRRNAQILDNIKYVQKSSPNNVSKEMVAEALGLERILVGKGMVPTNNEEASAAAFSDLWDDEYAMVCKISTPMREGQIAKPGIGRVLHWREDGSVPGGTVELYYNDEKRCEVVRVRHDVDEKIEVVQSGWLLSNITT